MTKKTPVNGGQKFTLRGEGGVLISAENGDIIRYDDSGLVLQLSDTVIEDIACRLPPLGANQPLPDQAEQQASNNLQDAEILGDIDAWHLFQQGDWLLFQANLPAGDGPRGYRRLVAEGAIMADAPGAVLGLISIGGPRRAVGIDGIGDFPYHVVGTNDAIDEAVETDSAQARINAGFASLRENTRDGFIAQAILRRRQSEHRALPLIMAHCDADQSTSAAALAAGTAIADLVTTAKTLAAAAGSMGKRAKILAVGLDYCLEDVVSTGMGYRDGIYALMAKIELALGALGYSKPRFVSHFECGDQISDAGSHTQDQWELAVTPSDHDLIYSAPGYMFAQTRHRRPTADALCQMGEMDAHAIEASLQVPRTNKDRENNVGRWFCPRFLLAERQVAAEQADGAVIRITTEAMSELVIDATADFGTVEHAGFQLQNVDNGARLLRVSRCPDQPQDILLHCDIAPHGENLMLSYACGQIAPADGGDQNGYPHNRGGIRDSWQAASSTGRQLHRWALPCVLLIH